MTVPEIALFHKARATFQLAARTGRHPDMLQLGALRYLDLLGNIYREAEERIPTGEKAYAPERLKKVYETAAEICVAVLTDEEHAQRLLPSERLVRDLGGPSGIRQRVHASR